MVRIESGFQSIFVVPRVSATRRIVIPGNEADDCSEKKTHGRQTPRDPRDLAIYRADSKHDFFFTPRRISATEDMLDVFICRVVHENVAKLIGGFVGFGKQTRLCDPDDCFFGSLQRSRCCIY